jgi:hypothetical protein
MINKRLLVEELSLAVGYEETCGVTAGFSGDVLDGPVSRSVLDRVLRVVRNGVSDQIADVMYDHTTAFSHIRLSADAPVINKAALW